jgi:hypothetical protein
MPGGCGTVLLNSLVKAAITSTQLESFKLEEHGDHATSSSAKLVLFDA